MDAGVIFYMKKRLLSEKECPAWFPGIANSVVIYGLSCKSLSTLLASGNRNLHFLHVSVKQVSSFILVLWESSFSLKKPLSVYATSLGCYRDQITWWWLPSTSWFADNSEHRTLTLFLQIFLKKKKSSVESISFLLSLGRNSKNLSLKARK